MGGHVEKSDIEQLNMINKKLDQNPSDVRLLLEKGFLLMEPFHDTEASLTLFRQAVELAPNNVDALFWLAKSLYHDHFQEQEPKALLEKALSIDPRRAEVHDFLAGILSSSESNLERSIFHFKKTIEFEPTWIWPRISLGCCFLKKNEFVLAEGELLKALDVFNKIVKPVPTSSMEKYFENCVTGRTERIRQHIDEMLVKIKNQQTK